MKTARVLYSQWHLAASQAADAAVLALELERAGYQVEMADNQGAVGGPVDLQFLIQNLQPNATKHTTAGRKNIFVPYPDQMPDWFKYMLGDFDACLCKTEEAAAWARGSMPADRVFMPGFTSRDCLVPEAARRLAVFHAGAGNPANGTQAAVEALKSLPCPTLSWFGDGLEIKLPPAWRALCFKRELVREKFDRLRNEHLLHYYPFTRENFGHLQNEARSLGAVLSRTPEELATRLKTPRLELEQEGYLNRCLYLVDDAAFKRSFAGVLAELERLPAKTHFTPASPATPKPAPSIRPAIMALKKTVPAYLFSKSRPSLRALAAPRQFDISIVTRCMNRRRFLERSLPTWTACPHVREIIIVDWSSTEPLQDIVDACQNGTIRRVFAPGQNYFHRAKSLNLGVRLASLACIANVDVDVLLTPDFFTIVTEENCLYTTSLPGVFGTCIFSRKIFETVNGYNEFFDNYGDEDTDFFQRVQKDHRFGRRSIPGHLCRHIDHGEKDRVENHRNKSLIDANLGAYGRWNTASKMESFTVVVTEPDGRQREITV